MFLSYIILIVSIFADQLNSYAVVLNTTACEPNRVYKKDDVTCICTKEGRWPHQNCSVIFKTNDKITRICKPNSYVTVDCNVCRCSKTGNIDKEFCTKHNCDGYNHIKIIRRSNNGKIKCEPNHWYALTNCRLCFCINRNNLLCNSGITNPKNVPLGTYNLTDCGSNLLSDINKLLSTKDPLGTNRSGKKKKKAIATAEYEIQTTRTTPTMKVTTEDIFSIMFNREGNKENKELSENSDNNDVDSSNEDPAPDIPAFPKDIPIGRLAANTVIPFENDEDDSTNYSVDSERNISEELDDKKRESDDLYKSREENSELLVENNQQALKHSDKTVINLNIPGILGKMFNLRKSMVSIDNANCVPGSTVVVECNTCFCLKNSKMLCTEKKCN